MKVLEVKNNLVKISYNTEEHLVLSGFVIIEDDNMPYVAQVVNLKADDSGNYAIVKLLFTFNSDGIVTNYDGSIPSLKALVTPLPSSELLDILPINTPLKLGVLAQQAFILNVDQTLLKKDLLICSDNNENTSTLINNFIKQAQRNNQKIVVCDAYDSIDHEDKFIFSEDFKLPLNYDTINYIWENDLDDVETISKAVIQDIFYEVQEYVKTAPHKYIPFNTFIEVVESQYLETNIPELILLKNKLLKYEENNIFANHHTEFESLKEFLEKNTSTVIDISPAINSKLQKQVIEFIYDVMHSMHESIIAITEINNANSDKKLIKRFYSSGNVFTSIICNHDYKYISELKQISRNMIFFPPQTVQHDFASYNTFLNKLNTDEFVVYGELTQNIPLIVQSMQLESLDTLERKIAEEKRIAEEKQKEFEKAQAELAEASKPIMTPVVDIDENNSIEELTNIKNEEEEINDTDYDEIEEIDDSNELSGNEIKETVFDDEITNEWEDNNSINEEIQNNSSDTIDEIIEQEDGSEIEEEILPPNAKIPEIDEYTESDSKDEEIIIEEELPEDPYKNIFDNQSPFDEPIQDKAAEDVDKYIIYNDSKDEIPSIDEVIEAEEKQLQESSNINDEENNFDSEAEQNNEVENEIDELEPIENIQDSTSTEIEQDDEPIEETPETEISNLSNSSDNDYFTNSNNKYVGLNDFEEISSNTEDNLTEDDLNFIDELNMDNQENAQEEQSSDKQENSQMGTLDELEDLAISSTENDDSNYVDEPQIVPIYDANENIDIVEGNVESFEQGDKVSHPKYGIGIVEKMIKYGNKTLCSINFENVGRRLLDPAISEISKA